MNLVNPIQFGFQERFRVNRTLGENCRCEWSEMAPKVPRIDQKGLVNTSDSVWDRSYFLQQDYVRVLALYEFP